ncbi:AraC-type DNA-binding protein [Catalinimonas alkaloidigena]|uniref:AraC-type DNA-binding protein n=1 Tax=Catalinimonas alkaloidigena TaxID=1075417 RepID=A0A1G9THL9_9BACT|nr:helix-turn-helix transcriptional regulator [Catalinimonas alkaloidigena]SDM47048.1 AraC-type DNA-binding protein [Catalinimonas alkaloidigena]
MIRTIDLTSQFTSATDPDIVQVDSLLPFEIRTLEWVRTHRWPQHSVPHRHTYFEIVWVTEGRGDHLIDLDKYPIADQTIHCLTPGQVHLFQADEGARGYVIAFTAEFLSRTEDNHDLLFHSGLFYNASHDPVGAVDAALREEIQLLVNKLQQEFENYFLMRSELLRGFLKILLIYLARQFEQVSPAPEKQPQAGLVTRFLALLDRQFATKKMVADYARALCVTPNYLNEIVKKSSGLPASEHIKQRILLEAKRQASYTQGSMKQIAYNLGFEDAAHFSKFFKNGTGSSFTDYKKEVACQYGT